MLRRVASRSFSGTGASNTPPARLRAAASSTTSESSGRRSAKRDAASGSRSSISPAMPVRGDQVIVTELLHRPVPIDAYLEMRTRDLPHLGARRWHRRLERGRRGRLLPARRGRACSDGERAGGCTASDALAYSPRPDVGAKHFRSLRLGGPVPALGHRRPAGRPGPARQDRPRTARRPRAARDDVPAQVGRHHDTRTGVAPARLALVRPSRRPPPPMPRWQEIAARLNHWALYVMLLRPAALRVADVLGRQPAGQLVRARAAAGLRRAGRRISRRPSRRSHEFLVNLLFVLVGAARRGGAQAPVHRPRRAPVTDAARPTVVMLRAFALALALVPRRARRTAAGRPVATAGSSSRPSRRAQSSRVVHAIPRRARLRSRASGRRQARRHGRRRLHRYRRTPSATRSCAARTSSRSTNIRRRSSTPGASSARATAGAHPATSRSAA